MKREVARVGVLFIFLLCKKEYFGRRFTIIFIIVGATSRDCFFVIVIFIGFGLPF